MYQQHENILKIHETICGLVSLQYSLLGSGQRQDCGPGERAVGQSCRFRPATFIACSWPFSLHDLRAVR